MKGSYRTRQQAELLRYLEQTAGEHRTAAEIWAHFAKSPKPIGMATIYRHLDSLVAEGVVRRYQMDSGDRACFQFVQEQGHCACHFHCKCEACGALLHMDCDELREIGDHLLARHGFLWNAGKTVFYGLCAACREKEGKATENPEAPNE